MNLKTGWWLLLPLALVGADDLVLAGATNAEIAVWRAQLALSAGRLDEALDHAEAEAREEGVHHRARAIRGSRPGRR